MPHLHHLQKNKDLLTLRFHLTRLIREFFWSEGFLEIESPTILRLPGQEPYLSPMKLDIHDETGKPYESYLHTSPEYTMKKMLAAGFDKIFYLGKVFRDYESFGGTHNPEFTMIEWYRANQDFYAIMDDVERLWGFLGKEMENLKSRVPAQGGSALGGINQKSTEIGNSLSADVEEKLEIGTFRRIHMRDLWEQTIDVNLDEFLTKESMFALCEERGYTPKEDEGYEDVFYRIFLNEIEPKLPELGPVILHHFPAPMAALSKLSDKEPGYAERFEVYIDGVELANCFTELTDADEQLCRLTEERELKKKLEKDVYDIDMEFIDALHHMPPSAGIALGVDRLIMALTGCKNINDVVAFPMEILMNNEH